MFLSTGSGRGKIGHGTFTAYSARWSRGLQVLFWQFRLSSPTSLGRSALGSIGQATFPLRSIFIIIDDGLDFVFRLFGGHSVWRGCILELLRFVPACDRRVVMKTIRNDYNIRGGPVGNISSPTLKCVKSCQSRPAVSTRSQNLSMKCSEPPKELGGSHLCGEKLVREIA